MSAIRVYELAKDLGITNSDLLAVLRDLGVVAVGGSAELDATTADTVREMITQDRGIIRQAKTVEIPATRSCNSPENSSTTSCRS